MSIRLGYQIPNFSYGTGAGELFPTVVAQAREAETAGFDTVLVMDHFYQLPGIGKPSEPMLEVIHHARGAVRRDRAVQLSALVTGNTYRNPAMLAKTVTTLDVVSGGRAVLGIGAGWFELEHQQMGYEFGTFTDRFERLDEALQIIEPMLRGRRASLDGEWYTADQAMNEPRIRDDLPIMLGGGGERKTFGLAARYADHLNIICDPDELPRKLEAVRQRCAEVDRDPGTLETSALITVIMTEDGDDARRLQRDAFAARGVDLETMDPDERARTMGRQFVGDPDEVAQQVQTRVLDAGVDGLIINMLANGHRPGVLELTGSVLRPLVGTAGPAGA